MSWNSGKASPIDGLSSGVMFYIANDTPEMTMRMPYNAILQWCAGVHKNDPFCTIYVHGDKRTWFKGEYCYSNQRYYFMSVGIAAVPDVILMMELLQP